jgi:vacuolar protein sorting-associated protein 13A/C
MSVKDSFAVAGKGIIAGMIDGISGTVQSPYKGLDVYYVKEAVTKFFENLERKAGIRGVFRGFGKGLIGFFAKPLASIFDGVSMTFDGLKRSQVDSEVVHHTRLPRHLIRKIVNVPKKKFWEKH